MYCAKCKKENREYAVYCQECGALLQPDNEVGEQQAPASPVDEPGRARKRKPLIIIGASAITLAALTAVIIVIMPKAEFGVDVMAIPETIVGGEEFTITARVENSGKAAGTHLLTLTIDEEEIATKEVQVDAVKVETTNFTITDLVPGTYRIGLAEWSGDLKVLKPAEFIIDSLTLNPREVEIRKEATVNARVSNIGEVAGSYTLTLSVNREVTLTEEIELSGNTSESFTYSLSLEEPGLYTVALNQSSGTLKVLKPAEFEVRNLNLSSTMVSAGRSVTVTVDVANIGEVEGAYTVTLLINGRTEQSKEVTVRANSTKKVDFSISRSSPGSYTVSVGSLSKKLDVIRIERPSTGTRITSKLTLNGNGELTIKNGSNQDTVVILSRSESTYLAVYVRANSTHTVRKIPDGTYRIYYTYGEDWDGHSKRFTRNAAHRRFEDKLNFTTTETSTTIYYTTYSITMHGVAGGTAATEPVNPNQFPPLR